MKQLLSIFFLCIGLTAHAQYTINVYPSGDRIFISSPTGLTPYPSASLLFNSRNNTVYIYSQGVQLFYATPAQFLNQSNGQWGTTSDQAVSNVVAAAKAAAGTVTPASFGTTQPTNATVTSPTSITTTNAIYIIAGNLSTSTGNLNVTYGNVTFTLLPGEERSFSAIYDYSSNKYAPLLTTITLTPAAGSTAWYNITPKQ